MLTTQSLIEAYNRKVADMVPDPRCQHPEAGPAFRKAGDERDYYTDGVDLIVRVLPNQGISLGGNSWRVHELLLLAETARELQTMGLGEVRVEVQGGAK